MHRQKPGELTKMVPLSQVLDIVMECRSTLPRFATAFEAAEVMQHDIRRHLVERFR